MESSEFLLRLFPQHGWDAILRKLKQGYSLRDLPQEKISPQLASLGVAFMMASQPLELTDRWIKAQAGKMSVITDIPDMKGKLSELFGNVACLTTEEDSLSQSQLFDDLKGKADIFFTRRGAVRHKKSEKKGPVVLLSDRAQQYVEDSLVGQSGSAVDRLKALYEPPVIVHVKDYSKISAELVLKFVDFVNQLPILLEKSGMPSIDFGDFTIRNIIIDALERHPEGVHEVLGLKMDLGAMHDPDNAGKVILVDPPKIEMSLPSDVSDIVIRSLCRVAPNMTMNGAIVPHYPKEFDTGASGGLKGVFERFFDLRGTGKEHLTSLALIGPEFAIKVGEVEKPFPVS